ncbi:hypothetical protein [Pseudoalteromonas ulvae]|uniref:hypothetical protein n=1 Tax=Pseudoalteromonas ulvae TaxID=107327 RepID=UPI00186B81EE|nr:hypothetical protein [Pseudoalteromonas ulvae]
MSNLVGLFVESEIKLGDGYIQKLTEAGGEMILKFFKESPNEAVLYFTLYTLVTTFLISIVILWVSKVSSFQVNTLELKNLINKFKYEFEISSWISVKVSRNNTCSKFYTLFVSLKDLAAPQYELINFKIYHEKCHLVSFDSFLSVFDKSLCLIVTCIFSMLTSGYVEVLFGLQETLWNPIIIIVSFAVAAAFISHFVFYPTRFKEFLCDLYAFICTGRYASNSYEKGRLDKLLHPSSVKRSKFILGSRGGFILFLICIEIFYWTLIYSLVFSHLEFFNFILPPLYFFSFLYFISWLWLFNICRS